MKSPKEDYKIRKSQVSDSGTREDPLIFFSFFTLIVNNILAEGPGVARGKKNVENFFFFLFEFLLA